MKVVLKNSTILTKAVSTTELVALLLQNRGLTGTSIDQFMSPPHPKTLSAADFGVDSVGLELALNRIRKAIDSQENILIYGDYDVDGITATAILWQVLYKMGARVTPFVPDREADGYGFKYRSFQAFCREKGFDCTLLITVDNGIVAAPEISQAAGDGIEVIVIDHHLPAAQPPPALAVVHSTEVSGAALSWLVASRLNPEADLGLAALGTVADCMPLIGVNRSLVTEGLRILRLSPCPGIRKLLDVARVKPSDLSAFHLGFVIGPRINAVGRLSNPTEALRLLCAPTAVLAAKYATVLDSYNRDRQILQADSLDLAEKTLSRNGDKLLLVADKSFLPGIIGLIAGRLTEKYRLPSIAISLNGEVAKGSCRSIPQLNIMEALRQVSDLFIDVGGHAGAAGFSIKEDNIPELRQKLTKVINQKLDGLDLEPYIEVEAEMKLNAVSVKNHTALASMEPFGIGNPEPLFVFKDIVIAQKRVVGQNGDHLQLKLDDPATRTIENTTTAAIAFKKGGLDGSLKMGDTVDIVASLSANTWNGVTTPQLLIKEIITHNP